MRNTLIKLALLVLGLVVWDAFLSGQEFSPIASYLPFHILIETTSIVIAMMIFVIGWHAHRHGLSGNILLLACAFLGVGIMDFTHMLSYMGMPDFITPSSPQKAINFWLAARAIAAISLLFVALYPWKPLASAQSRHIQLTFVLIIVTALHWLFLFHSDLVPATFIPGQGLTQFKIFSEYGIVALNLITVVLLWGNMRKPQVYDAAGLLGAVFAMAMSEMFFTLYANVSDLFNLYGHICKAASYLFLYRAIFSATIEFPYQQLHESESKLQATLKAIPDLLFEVGLDGRCYDCHCSNTLPLQYPNDGFIGKRLHEILPAETVEICLSALREAHLNGYSKGQQFEFEMLNGKHWFELSVATKSTESHRSPRFIVLARDITKRKLSEIELRVLNEQLEQRVSDRTQAVEKSKVLADEAVAAKSEFLANMSHEIRTPMNSILGMAHLANKVTTDAKTRQYIENIQISGQHLLSIIDDILNFSKIASGKFTLEHIDFYLKDVLHRLKNMVSDKAKINKLRLEFDIDPGLPTYFNGDPVRLFQVLMNLADNAIKFTERGQIVIRATKIMEDEEFCRVRFEVQDSGIGISKENISNLFQAFQQANSQSTRQHGGTGLGLAISKQLVEMMDDGKIGVESIPGQGSMFWFEVRLSISKPPKKPKKSKEKSPSSEHFSLKGIRVLLAENNLFNQQVATEILENEGITVCIANNGSEAIDLLEKEPFDCVLMDLQMPVMDGFEAARNILNNPKFTQLPIIAMTANVSTEDRKKCRDAGMVDFISKPFTPEKLFETIAKWQSVQPIQMDFFGQAELSTTDLADSEDRHIIDFSVLSQLVGNNLTKMREFANMFLDLALKDMVKIDTALKQADFQSLAKLAHHNRSPALMVGAIGFAELCSELEKQSKQTDELHIIAATVSKMRSQLDQIKLRFSEIEDNFVQK